MQPDKETVNGIEYYIGYKGLNADLKNFQKNYTYKVGYRYSVIDVDLSNKECS